MKFNFNKIEQIRKDEGFKNPNDIWDMSTFEDIMGEIEDLPKNIDLNIEEKENMSVEKLELFSQIKDFVNQTSEVFRREFLEMMKEYQEEKKMLNPKIKEFIQEKSFDLPAFDIFDKDRANSFLEKNGFSHEISDDNFLVNFQLPKPLAHFWWKGGKDLWGSPEEIKDTTTTEWGYFYRKLMGVVWGMQGYFENEKNLYFERINSIGEHDPKSFYYLWEVGLWRTDD